MLTHDQVAFLAVALWFGVVVSVLFGMFWLGAKR
jgi:hypothetical protein